MRPELHSTPDQVILDNVATLEYFPGPQTTERLTITDEEVLIRRIPNLVAWSWYEDGILFTVVANGIDPLAAGEFVEAIAAAQ